MNDSNRHPQSTGSDSLPRLSAAQLNFTGSPHYVNRTARFVLAVPALAGGGEPLLIPQGDPRAGQVLKKDSSGRIGRGVVFFNGTDRAWQAARGDGREAILFNDIGADQAKLLQERLLALTPQGAPLTLASIKSLLHYAQQELGLLDCYHKRLDSVQRDMVAISPANPHYLQVSKPVRHRALWVQRPFSFDGPVLQHYPEGAVLVTDERHVWGVAAAVFLRNYRQLEGAKERALGSVTELRAWP
ncbi:hypothetical protein [Inhella proteolytica]|uniref:Uncharacterized protein n=1 Tax=Inhella proteolytica TaxID=2795029 RepID=A0A931J514_9BURK|nr:hypothetical protein [Inhella proteolytica]MBH9578335.1 hypothetical protein [Inhella proteolytica]